MPHHLSRVIHLLVGSVIVAGMLAAPGVALAARPVRTVETWIVTMRQPETDALPTRRGGLRPAAMDIARRRAAVASRNIETLETRVGFRASQRFTWAVSGFAARLDTGQLAALRNDRRVLSIRPDRPVTVAGGGQIVPTSVDRVRARAEGALAASANVSVAVMDTGVGRWAAGAWRHGTELNVVGGVDAYSPGTDCGDRVAASPAAYDDDHGHGTHVAGTIGAADNGVGVVGVSPGVKLLSVRVFDHGLGSRATIICGLDWIAAWNANHPEERHDIDVVNMSLRAGANTNADAGCGTPGNTDLEELAICAVIDSGASVVVAAGNESREVAGFIPSRYDSVITVSAMSDFDGAPGGLSAETCVPPEGVERDDTFARYSNFGPEVDVTAPGTCVRSTALGSAGGVVAMTGTSMATPHVTGAVARYLGLHPAKTPDEVRRALIGSASFDWDADTDPDGMEDRLVDVAALVSAQPDLALFTLPQTIAVPGGADQRSARVRLQRVGGYAGAVGLSVVDPLPDGVTSADFNEATIPAGELGRNLTLTFAARPENGVRTLTLRAEGEGSGPADQVTLDLRFDRSPPTIGSPWPRVVFRAGTWTDLAPVRLSWSAEDGEGPLARQAVQRSRDGSSFRAVLPRLSRTADSATVPMERRVSTAWRIKAWDEVGNATLSEELVTRLVPTQAGNADRSEGWWTIRRTTASAHDLLVTKGGWRWVTHTFTGRGVAIVAPTGPDRGRFRVRVDGEVVADVDLSGTRNLARRIVFASSALTPGAHTIRVTSRTGTVELDAFLVLK